MDARSGTESSAAQDRESAARSAARSVIASAERQAPGNDWWSVRIARHHVEALLAENDRLREQRDSCKRWHDD